MMMLWIMFFSYLSFSVYPLILLITGIDVIHFSFFNELLSEISVYNLFISQHSSEQVIYVVAFSHSGL